MPFLPGTIETQGITDDNLLNVYYSGFGHVVTPNGVNAQMRMTVPYANYQEIQRELVGYSFISAVTPDAPNGNKNPDGTPQIVGTRTMLRKLPEIYYYYPQKWGWPTTNAPTLQDNLETVSAKGYPVYCTSAKFVRGLKDLGDPAPPAGYRFSPGDFVSEGGGKPTRWKPEAVFERAELELTFATLPWTVCFANELTGIPKSASPEACRYTTIRVRGQNRMISGDWAQWVFDPLAAGVPETSLRPVGKNFAMPEASAIIDVVWYDVAAGGFQPLALQDLGAMYNKAPFTIGAFNLAGGPGGYMTFPAEKALLLSYDPEPVASAWGDASFNVKMSFLYEPQGVNAAFDVTNPVGNGYSRLHARILGSVPASFDPTFNYIRPIKGANFQNLFQYYPLGSPLQ